MPAAEDLKSIEAVDLTTSQPPQDILREAPGAKERLRSPAAAPKNAKVMTNAMLRRSTQPSQGKTAGLVRPQAGNVQHFQRSYERYLSLARAEVLIGDRIAAENYFQHAEHYFRAMSENNA